MVCARTSEADGSAAIARRIPGSAAAAQCEVLAQAGRLAALGAYPVSIR